MKARANTVFSLVLAAGLALLTFWLERLVDAPGSAAADAARRDPDFTLDNATATTFSRLGRPDSTLTAQKMFHFPDETSELEEPRLLQQQEQGPPVRIAADRGTVFKDNEEVRLYGNVVVRREATADRPELRMETTYLEVFPKEDVARTPERVVIREGRTWITGVGMRYDHKTRQLQLKARVSGSYEREEG